MKTYNRVLLVLLLSLSFLSCSKDDIDENGQLLGTWEVKTTNVNSVKTYQLIFSPENICYEVSTEEFETGETISGTTDGFSWELSNNIVRLQNGDDTVEYILNTNNQLVLSTSEDFYLVKVSDDYWGL